MVHYKNKKPHKIQGFYRQETNDVLTKARKKSWCTSGLSSVIYPNQYGFAK